MKACRKGRARYQVRREGLAREGTSQSPGVTRPVARIRLGVMMDIREGSGCQVGKNVKWDDSGCQMGVPSMRRSVVVRLVDRVGPVHGWYVIKASAERQDQERQNELPRLSLSERQDRGRLVKRTGRGGKRNVD